MHDSNMSAIVANLTSELNRLKQYYYPIIIPPILFLCLLTILANGMVLLSVRWLHRAPSPLLMFTISLCVADFWLAIQQSVNFVLEGYLPHVLDIKVHHAPCQGLMMEAVRCGALITSVLHLLALASNHYIGIVRPLHYKNTMTPELTYVVICIIWFLPTVGLIAFFSLKSNDGFIPTNCANSAFYSDFSFRLAIGSIFIIPLILMFFIYAHVAVLLIRRRHNPHLSAHMPAKQLRRNLKAATTTTLYLGTFTICWMPSVIVSIMLCQHGCPIHFQSFALENPETLLIIGGLTQVSIVVKALCDAAIYAARVREIQYAMWSMHARLCCCGPWNVCKSFDASSSEFRSSVYQGGHSSIANSRSILDRDRPRSLGSSGSIFSHRTPNRNHFCRYSSLPEADQLQQLDNGETDNHVTIEHRPMRPRRPHDHHPNKYRKVSIQVPPSVNEESLRELDMEVSCINGMDTEELCPDHVIVNDSPTAHGSSDFTVVSAFALPQIGNSVNV